MGNSEQGKYSFITRDETNILKGVALVFMFIHHFFTLSNFWIDSVFAMYPSEDVNAWGLWAPLFKICVPIFVFLTGYFYFFSKKTYRYSIRKISDLYINYIIVFLLLLSIAILLNVYQFSFPMFLAEAAAIVRPNMTHGWYVLFYAMAMLLMPIYAKIAEKNDLLAFSLFTVVPWFVNSGLSMTGIPLSSAMSDVLDYLLWLPCMASGFCFAKYDMFGKIAATVITKSKFLNAVISILFMMIPFIAQYLNSYLSFINVPMFLFGLLSIIKTVKVKWIFAPISVIVKYSVLMWFTHCIFANPCAIYTQPILYYPQNPILVTVWGLLMCLAAAFVLKFPIDLLIKWKNKIFRL